jgi:hypothetical protein
VNDHEYVLAAATHASSGGAGWLGYLLLILLGVGLGRFWGRWAALKHLGTAEFRNRWATIHRIRRW